MTIAGKNSLIEGIDREEIIEVLIPLVVLEQIKPAQAFIDANANSITERSARAPVVVTGDNIYVAWWTNNTANKNEEVMFRASNDGGQTFSDKINLSNYTYAETQNADIIAEGNNRVLVSWWETNPVTGSSESVLRVSNDSGKTFGPMVMLGMNGTLSTSGNRTEISSGDTIRAR
ncbi:MAG: hypothetical protein M3261_04705 [Thermoproteota archaeon]|nr:hypothetical protein [Thermoproteota archaeon]